MPADQLKGIGTQIKKNARKVLGNVAAWFRHQAQRIRIQRRTKAERLAEKEAYINQLFDNEPVALMDDLKNSWELSLMMFLNRFRRDYIPEQIRTYKEKLSRITFLKSEGESTPEATGKDTVSYLNYHFLGGHFGWIRLGNQPTIWMLVLFLLLLFFIPMVMPILLMTDMLTPSDSIGLRYEAPVSGEYLLYVHNNSQETSTYSLGYQPVQSSNVNPPVQQGVVFPLGFGQEVFSLFEYSEFQHIYSFYARAGQIFYVQAYRGYLDSSIRFEIKDASMFPCATLLMDPGQLEQDVSWLSCEVMQDGNYYLLVEPVEDVMLGWQARYAFIANALDEEVEPDDDQSIAYVLEPGDFIRGTASNADPDWYRFSAQAGEEIFFQAYAQDNGELSLSLYQPGEAGPTLAAFSNKGVSSKSMQNQKMLESARGRAGLIYTIARIYGINPPFRWLVENDVPAIVIVETILIVLGTLLFFGFNRLDWFTTSRKYDRSQLVINTINILEQLSDDDVLHSTDKRLRLMKSVRSAAFLIPGLYKLDRTWMRRTTPETKAHYERIAAQVLKRNEMIAAPASSTLVTLRAQFAEWLDIFMKGEFGNIQITDEISQPRWHQKAARLVEQNWIKWMFGAVVGVIVLAWIYDKNPQVANSLFELFVLLIRYVLLILIVFVIFLQWGTVKSDTAPVSRWHEAARFILFFLIPFIILDNLLDTNILESLAKVVEGLKFFD
jgi:hypothetical protein